MIASDGHTNRRTQISSGELLGWVGLAGLLAFYLACSWRKWPDLLRDFGNELYIPWRLSEGAVLYRDVDHVYGPLSQYFHAGLFRLFGPGMMVLVVANLVVFTAILSTIYYLFRRAWGIGAALASCALFIAVFGFSQFIGIGNYNFATPYAHEATHSLLVSLVLIIALLRWMERGTFVRGFMAGALFGLTPLLKPEFMLACGLVSCIAVVIRWRQGRAPEAASLAGWTAGAILPTAGFAAFFSTYLPWAEALKVTSRAWLNVVSTSRFTGDIVQQSFLGFDQPWANLLRHITATLWALLLIGGLCGAALAVDRLERRASKILIGASLLGAVAWLAVREVDWINTGTCVLGLTLCILIYESLATTRRSQAEEDRSRHPLRLLIGVLAASLMARMLLNGRIYQFGFCQAALASLCVAAFVIGELPTVLRLKRGTQILMVTASLVLLGIGVIKLTILSQDLLRLKTYPIAEGRDRFYTYPPNHEPTGEIVATIHDRLRQSAGTRTLLVLPEGAMINYLTRRPSTIVPFFFFSSSTADGREEDIVHDLERHPPDAIVVVSRDLREYGIRRYGEKPGQGQQLLRWVISRYQKELSIGGNPLDPEQVGGVLLTLKTDRERKNENP